VGLVFGPYILVGPLLAHQRGVLSSVASFRSVYAAMGIRDFGTWLFVGGNF
jgi:hypothetical protein